MKQPSRISSWLESLIFREPDLDAIARGWDVRRERPFHRSYRDPRWDTIAVRPGCRGGGDGSDGGGRGTIRRTATDTVDVR